jgi:hypothetical protein
MSLTKVVRTSFAPPATRAIQPLVTGWPRINRSKMAYALFVLFATAAIAQPGSGLLWCFLLAVCFYGLAPTSTLIGAGFFGSQSLLELRGIGSSLPNCGEKSRASIPTDSKTRTRASAALITFSFEPTCVPTRTPDVFGPAIALPITLADQPACRRTFTICPARLDISSASPIIITSAHWLPNCRNRSATNACRAGLSILGASRSLCSTVWSSASFASCMASVSFDSASAILSLNDSASWRVALAMDLALSASLRACVSLVVKSPIIEASASRSCCAVIDNRASVYNSPETPSTTNMPPSFSSRVAGLKRFRKPITVGAMTGDNGIAASTYCNFVRGKAELLAIGGTGFLHSGLARCVYHSYIYSYIRPTTTTHVQKTRDCSRVAKWCSRTSMDSFATVGIWRGAVLRDTKNALMLCFATYIFLVIMLVVSWIVPDPPEATPEMYSITTLPAHFQSLPTRQPSPTLPRADLPHQRPLQGSCEGSDES